MKMNSINREGLCEARVNIILRLFHVVGKMAISGSNLPHLGVRGQKRGFLFPLLTSRSYRRAF